MELLAPDPQLLVPEGDDGEGTPDHAPDWLVNGTPQPLRARLTALLGAERLKTRAIDLIAYASDASPYRKIPQVVVMARDSGDIAKVFAFGREHGVPVTLRGGGTSLNGQGQTDGILVDVRRNWSAVKVEDGGDRVRLGPGTLLGAANRVLAPHGRKLGPDPASTEIATVGGVIANNSGGMRCGVVRDSYSTVRSMTLVLPSGTTIDTAAPDAAQAFAAAEPELAGGLAAIRDEICADAELSARIRRKFEIKNTTGYRLCAFLDADDPLEIFRRLVVGSEGTLAFVAEAVFETVPRPAMTRVAWLHFPGIEEATDVVPALVATGASAVELMVAPALIVAAHNIAGAPEYWKELAPETAALLVEFGATDPAELDRLEAAAMAAIAGADGGAKLIREPEWTSEAHSVEVYWQVREGMHGLVGRLRVPGTALIVEDVCVRPERIAESARDIQALLGEHGFLTGVAGHASVGNLHFMLTPDFAKPEDTERYESFMEKLVTLVLDKYDGSLKAEHGTGVNMAPYVEREWGSKATELMWRVKQLADPDGMLNPGVVLNRDPGVHLRDLKTTPPIEEVATACVECGFCEPVCPSRDLTLTPRQRIVVRREIARQPRGSTLQGRLLDEYEYDGLETCAADGSCRAPCPVGIDTGKLVKQLRERQHSERANASALKLAERYASVERAARRSLAAGALAPPLARAGAAAARLLLSDELVPSWPGAMPDAAPARLPATTREGAAALYMPSCVNRIFGTARGSKSPHVVEALVTLSARAGHPLWIPDQIAGACCATPWTSKGYAQGAELMANRTFESLWEWSGEGTLPIVTDASSCALGLSAEMPPRLSEPNRERHGKLVFFDSVDWAHDRLLPNLEVTERLGSVALHPTCSTRQLGLSAKLKALGEALAERAEVPAAATCCGMAGDRGMLHPELTAAATAPQAAELALAKLAGAGHDAHLSSNRTCEIGLSEATGETYESVVIALERATRPEPVT